MISVSDLPGTCFNNIYFRVYYFASIFQHIIHLFVWPCLEPELTMGWEDIAADKKKRIADSIPQEWRIKSEPTDVSVMAYPKQSGIMSAEELAITESTAVDLVAQLAAGKLSSVAVTTAFLKRAALAHQLVSFSPLRIRTTDGWLDKLCSRVLS